ncbi:MAG: hypothetical protein KF865_04965 [Bdellovibrionaceae bacterium]|nr:hypothetical protein [Pseudobdellovibrionaceae bacterium]
MSFIGRSAIKKHMAKVQATVGLSACCVVLSSCGSGLPTSASQPSTAGGGAPSMALQVDELEIGTWDPVSSTVASDLHCKNGDSDYKFRLVNSGTGSLNAAGTVVSISKTSDYVGGTMNGTPGDYTFSVQSQPAMPVAAGASSEFTIRLSNTNGDCMLGGRGYNHEGLETALVTISTDDPDHPTFSATIQVFGSS